MWFSKETESETKMEERKKKIETTQKVKQRELEKRGGERGRGEKKCNVIVR